MINYELSLLLAIGAFVFSNLLTDENQILNGVYKWLYKIFKTDERKDDGKPVHPLFMALMYCEKCVAGQWSFWFFLFANFSFYNFNLFFTHIFFVLTTIFLAALIKLLYELIKEYTNKIKNQ